MKLTDEEIIKLAQKCGAVTCGVGIDGQLSMLSNSEIISFSKALEAELLKEYAAQLAAAREEGRKEGLEDLDNSITESMYARMVYFGDVKSWILAMIKGG